MIRNLRDPPDGHTLAAILQQELERADGLERGLSLCREEVAISVGGITTYRQCTMRAIMRAAHDQLMMAKHAGGDRIQWTVHVPPEHSVTMRSSGASMTMRGEPTRVRVEGLDDETSRLPA